ncbi:MAG: hypothetical protein AAGK04_13920, partial [Planctomycetota bacterium]
MSQAITRYDALFQSMRSRRARPEMRAGLDAIYNRFAMKAKHAGSRATALRREAEAVDLLGVEMHNHSERLGV